MEPSSGSEQGMAADSQCLPGGYASLCPACTSGASAHLCPGPAGQLKSGRFGAGSGEVPQALVHTEAATHHGWDQVRTQGGHSHSLSAQDHTRWACGPIAGAQCRPLACMSARGRSTQPRLLTRVDGDSRRQWHWVPDPRGETRTQLPGQPDHYRQVASGTVTGLFQPHVN